MISDPDISGDLKKVMREYYDQVTAMSADADVREARQRVQDLSKRLQSAENKLAEAEEPYRDVMQKKRAQIEHLSHDVGESFEWGGVQVKYRSGYTRDKWDTGSLEELIEELRAEGVPELADRILEAKGETVVSPSAKVVQ